MTHLLNEFFSSCKARQLEAKRKATTSRPGLPSTAARACGGEQPTLPKIGSGITLLPRENLRSMDLCWDQSCHVNVMGTGENRGWEPFLRMGAVSRTPPLALWRKRSRASLSPNHKSQTPGSPQAPPLSSLPPGLALCFHWRSSPSVLKSGHFLHGLETIHCIKVASEKPKSSYGFQLLVRETGWGPQLYYRPRVEVWCRRTDPGHFLLQAECRKAP